MSTNEVFQGGMVSDSIKITMLGQVGVRLEFKGTVIYIDPYLSNSVQEKEDSSIARLKPIPVMPETITDANYVLITHAHRDHCDPDTLLPLAKASQYCMFIGPPPVYNLLLKNGLDADRLAKIGSKSFSMNDEITISAVPAAHPKVKPMEDSWSSVGYVLNISGRAIYHAGDTSLDEEVLHSLLKFGKMHVAMIPVNEVNYMRDKQGIIGNMSVREAFYMAELLQSDIMVPTHWDMFEANQVYKEEIELLYHKIKPTFSLEFDPGTI